MASAEAQAKIACRYFRFFVILRIEPLVRNTKIPMRVLGNSMIDIWSTQSHAATSEKKNSLKLLFGSENVQVPKRNAVNEVERNPFGGRSILLKKNRKIARKRHTSALVKGTNDSRISFSLSVDSLPKKSLCKIRYGFLHLIGCETAFQIGFQC